MAVKGKLADFSKFQGNVDWAKVAEQIDCAIIRVQYGSNVIDTKYKEYVDGCKANNLPFGHYAFAQFVSISDAEQEAKDFLARADKDAKFLVVDVEEVTTRNHADLVPATQAFIDYLHKNGVEKVGLYTGKYFEHSEGLDKIKADFIWIASYGANNGQENASAKPNVGEQIWQYTSTGKLEGVSGNVDLDVLDGNKDLSWFIGEQVSVTIPSAKADQPKAETTTVKVESPKKAPVKKVVPAPKAPSTEEYKIVSGDTLSGIAVKFHTTIDEIKNLNGMKDDTIYAGKSIKVPSGSAPKVESKPTPKPAPKPVSKPLTDEYEVKMGDTLSGIALKFHTTVAEIQKLNGMKHTTIYGGQKLKVPASKVAPKLAPKQEFHIVQSGDTVSELSVKYGSTVAEIQAWNKLDRNYTIKVNQKLRVK